MAATTGPSHVAPGAPPTDEPLRPSWFERRSEGRPWFAPATVGVVVGLATAYTGWQNPNADGVFPPCPTQAVFGVDCPGCGGLRATHALVHGDLARSLDHNVLVAVLLPVAALVWAVWMARALRSTWAAHRRRAAGADDVRPRAVAFPVRFPSGSSPFWKVATALVIGFAIVRNIGVVPLFEYLHSDV